MAPASVLPSGGTTLLLEREAQVAALEALAEAARSGGGRFVVVEGSAGIGKTRLLAEARAIAGSAGMRTRRPRRRVRGRFAYGIVRQLFEPLLASAARISARSCSRGLRQLVEPLFGASQLAESQDLPAEGSFAILHGLYWLAANVAFQQPTLLAIDDLHWADIPSLRWLLYLTRRLEGVPPRRRRDAAARGEGAIPHSSQSSSPIRRRRDSPRTAWALRSPCLRASCTVSSRTKPSAPPWKRRPAAIRSSSVRCWTRLHGREPARPPSTRPSAGNGSAGRCSRRRASPRPPAAGGARLLAASVLGDGPSCAAAALAGVEAGELGATAAASVGLTSSVAKIRSSSSTLSSAAPSARRSMWSNETPRTARPLNCCSRPARRRRVRRGTSSAWPRGRTRSWSRRSAKRPSAHSPRARPRSPWDISHACSTRQPDPATQAEVLVELGLAERRTNGPAAAEHLRAGLELLADPERRCAVALELGRALWFTDRIADALAVFEQALDEVGRKATQTSTSCSWRSSSARPGGALRLSLGRSNDRRARAGCAPRWPRQRDPARDDGAHEYRQGLHRERAVELAGGARAREPAGERLDRVLLRERATPVGSARRGAFHPRPGSRAGSPARRHLQRRVHVDVARQMSDGSRRSSSRSRRSAGSARSASRTACASPGRTTSGSWRMRCWSRGRRTKRRESSIRVTFQSSSRSTRRTSFTFASTAAVSASRPEALSGKSRSCSRLAMPFGRSASTIQAACPGGAGPPKASDVSTGDDEARALAEGSSRSLDGGATRRPSAPLCARWVWSGRRGGYRAARGGGRAARGSEARLEHARALVDLGAALRRANQRTEARERLREGVDLARTVGAFALAERANEEIAATGARPRKVLQTGLDALTASERRVAQLARPTA